ncbi:protein kinase, partial [Streptomyces albogriseolus]
VTETYAVPVPKGYRVGAWTTEREAVRGHRAGRQPYGTGPYVYPPGAGAGAAGAGPGRETR